MAQSKETYTGKVVLVGDGSCGKTCLLEVFKRNEFPEEYIPTVVDNFVKDVDIDDTKKVTLTLWDTAGQEAYDSVRPMSYTGTDLVLLCYTIENQDMLPNITEKWMPEILNYCPNAAVFLIGLKKDIRESIDPLIDQEKLVPFAMGEKITKENDIAEFYECSAKTGENVKEIFTNAAKFIMELRMKSKAKRGFPFCCC